MPYVYICIGTFIGFTLAALLSANTAQHREQRIGELEDENRSLKVDVNALRSQRNTVMKRVDELLKEHAPTKRKPKRGGQTMGVVA